MASTHDAIAKIDTAHSSAEQATQRLDADAAHTETVSAQIDAARADAEALAQWLQGMGVDDKAQLTDTAKTKLEETQARAAALKTSLEANAAELRGTTTALAEARTIMQQVTGLTTASAQGVETRIQPVSPSDASEGRHPAYGRPASLGATTSNDYKKTFFDKHPETRDKIVVHHAIEQQAQKRYPGLISDSQLHSYENLRGIPKGEVNRRVHLSAIRKSWNRFYKKNPNPTTRQLLDHATRIDDEHGGEFNPPVR